MGALVFIFILTLVSGWNPAIAKNEVSQKKASTKAPASTKTFKNSYIQFEMPSRWNCQLKHKAYLCRHRISTSCKKTPSSQACKDQIKASREALIVMSAKPKSNIDTMEAFASHFGEARQLKKSGASSQSKVVHNKKVAIKKHQWVDTMHLGSEIPHYYTRYLATIKGNVAVLVSFTSHKKFYTKYSNQFFKGIKSLEVTASELSNVKKDELGERLLSRPIDIPDEFFEDSPQEPTPEDPLSNVLFGLAMMLAAAGVYLWIKRKKSL